MAAETKLHSDMNDAERMDNFRFLALTLAALARGFLQNVMRSVLVICKRSRIHQGAYIKDPNSEAEGHA